MKRKSLSILIAGFAVLTAGGAALAQPDRAMGTVEKAQLSVKPGAAGMTAEQRARLNEKLRMVGEIIAQMEPQARADGLAPGWRQSTVSTLYGLSNETLAGMMGVRSVNDLPSAIAHAKRVAPKALGSQTEDVVYTPITPCRYIDTRDVGGKITGTRSYDLDLNSYTVSPIKCANDPYGIFGSTLAALAVNLAIVDPSGAPGFATIVPHQAATSVALMNWYEAGPSVQASNAAIVTINQGGLLPEIDIFTSGAVHAIVDIFGAFRASGATALDCTNAYGPFITVNPGADACGNPPACPTGYTFVAPLFDNQGFGGLVMSQMNRASGFLDICGRNTGGVAQEFAPGASCCRVPGR